MLTVVCLLLEVDIQLIGEVAQLGRATDSYSVCQWFESTFRQFSLYFLFSFVFLM